MPPVSFAGFLLAIVAILLIAFFSYESLRTRATTGALVSRTLESLQQGRQALRSTLKDAETRGAAFC